MLKHQALRREARLPPIWSRQASPVPASAPKLTVPAHNTITADVVDTRAPITMPVRAPTTSTMPNVPNNRGRNALPRCTGAAKIQATSAGATNTGPTSLATAITVAAMARRLSHGIACRAFIHSKETHSCIDWVRTSRSTLAAIAVSIVAAKTAIYASAATSAKRRLARSLRQRRICRRSTRGSTTDPFTRVHLKSRHRRRPH